MSDLSPYSKPWSLRTRLEPKRTYSGRVVYDRKKHPMTIRDAARIFRQTRVYKQYSGVDLPYGLGREDFNFLQWHEFIAWGILYGLIDPRSINFETVQKELPNQWAWNILTGLLDFVDPTDVVGKLVKEGAYWLIDQVEGAWVEKTLGGGVVPTAIYQAVVDVGDQRYPWPERTNK